jgi:meso-butanediol dehydrogenase / (S,S)-butanediol dehydrogenase / diacetyl reductase
MAGGTGAPGTLHGKTALVTGGGRGIGRGIALALASAGAAVAVCGRSLEPLEQTVHDVISRGGQAKAIRCDVTDPAALEALVRDVVAEYGGVNILVNNALQTPRGTLLEISEETVNAAWQSGPMACLRLMRLCHPYLKGGGCVVNVSSGSSLSPDQPFRGVYAATKSAINAISRAAAVEWGPDGIRVNVLMPFGKSDSVARFIENEPDFAAQVLRATPLGRFGDPETDIGRAVAFLCGPDAGFITGTTIPVDGGRSYLR